ncbi:MAG TPA: hypothetical protein VJ279_06650 [Hanamia sp.]|nr:hypothetical protein [Hanamia sp.]
MNNGIITGKSERWGRNLIEKIKSRNHKVKHQLVTIDEFCNYTGLATSAVEKKLYLSPPIFSFLFQSIPLLLHSQKSSLLEIIYWEFRPDSYREPER